MSLGTGSVTNHRHHRLFLQSLGQGGARVKIFFHSLIHSFIDSGELITVRVDVPRAALRGANFVPHLRNVTVAQSYYDGVNFTNVDNMLFVEDSRFYDNRGLVLK